MKTALSFLLLLSLCSQALGGTFLNGNLKKKSSLVQSPSFDSDRIKRAQFDPRAKKGSRTARALQPRGTVPTCGRNQVYIPTSEECVDKCDTSSPGASQNKEGGCTCASGNGVTADGLHCKPCDPSTQITSKKTNKCIRKCDTSTGGMQKQGGKGGCKNCPTGTQLNDNGSACIATCDTSTSGSSQSNKGGCNCSTGFGRTGTNNGCMACSSNQITKNNYCKTCDDNQVVQNNQCLTCSADQYADATTNTCKSCTSGKVNAAGNGCTRRQLVENSGTGAPTPSCPRGSSGIPPNCLTLPPLGNLPSILETIPKRESSEKTKRTFVNLGEQ